jgi:hypothetical protein
VRRGGTTAGLVLVIVGVIMLFGRFVQWFDVFRLWPLLIVIGGVAEIVRGRREPLVKRVAEGAGSIVVGFVLLANTFGYLSWGVWITILSLWPLLVVAIGIELLGRGLGLPWVRALSNVVLIVGLLYGAFVLAPGTVGLGLSVPGLIRPGSSYSSYATSKPHDAAVTTGSATVKAGATRLKVGAGADLARISGSAPADGAPTLSSVVGAGNAEVSVEEPSRSVAFGIEERTLDLTLDAAVTWKNLRLDIGAVQADADLSGLKVDALSVNVGASDLAVTIGKLAPAVTVDISGGAANVVLRVPASAAVKLDSKSGLSNVTVPSGFRHISGMPVLGESSWAADGSGGPTITVTLQSGVSNLTVETY